MHIYIWYITCVLISYMRMIVWFLQSKFLFYTQHVIILLNVQNVISLFWRNIIYARVAWSRQSWKLQLKLMSKNWLQCIRSNAHMVLSFYASAFRRRRHYVFGLSVLPSVRPPVRPSEARNTLVPPVHGSIGPSDQPWPFYGMSVRPPGEVSGHLPEKTWREWPEILHADVSWPPPKLIRLWSRSVHFLPFGATLT